MNFIFSLPFHLKLAGATLIFLGFAHLCFDKRFQWREETAQLSLLNRQIFYVHTFYVAFVVALMGILALFGTQALLEPTLLGRWVCGGLSIFWATRLFCQFFVYSSALWKGRRFETFIHLVFALAWAYYTGVFAWAWWMQSHSSATF